MIGAVAASACLALASQSYHVSKAAIDAVLSAPAGTGGVGPMHIPSAWLPILDRAGFASDQVQTDPCTNIEAGTWILAYEQSRHPSRQPTPAPTSPPPDSAVTLAAEDESSTDACVTKAAKLYHIPVTLMTAVLRTEGGHVGQIHENDNGSYDMGPAQINSIWLPVLAQSGITRDMVLNNRCLNITIGAWILAQSLNGANPQNPAEFWQRVGDYNSHTPHWNHEYALKVWNNLP